MFESLLQSEFFKYKILFLVVLRWKLTDGGGGGNEFVDRLAWEENTNFRFMIFVKNLIQFF